jgi:outer membrane protein TolC
VSDGAKTLNAVEEAALRKHVAAFMPTSALAEMFATLDVARSETKKAEEVNRAQEKLGHILISERIRAEAEVSRLREAISDALNQCALQRKSEGRCPVCGGAEECDDGCAMVSLFSALAPISR